MSVGILFVLYISVTHSKNALHIMQDDNFFSQK